MKITRMVAFVLSVALFAGMTLGCNTIRGVGKDVEKGGRAIQDVTTK
jgi:predicted small secreted protein